MTGNSSTVPGPAMLRELWRCMYMERELSVMVEQRNASSIHKVINIGTRVGQEAVMPGFCLAFRRAVDMKDSGQPHDLIVGFSGKFFLPMGMDLGRVLAECYGKADGYMKGKAGPVSIGSPEHGLFGHIGLIGADCPHAVGLGFVAKWESRGQVVGCVTTDGGFNTGRFYESLNLAVLHNLPIVFGIVNNYYATSMPVSRSVATGDMAARASEYGVPSLAVDGQDVLAVYQASREAADRARRGEGPSILEFQTYRFGAQNAYDEKDYRPREEVEAWQRRDPITMFRGWLASEGGFSEAELGEIEEAGRNELARAFRFADESPYPDLAEAETDVYVPAPALPWAKDVPVSNDRKITYAQALAEAQAQAMRRDPKVFIIGLDIGRFGSHEGQTEGLWSEFGDDRVLDMPIVEATIAGVATGAAMGGYRPIVSLAELPISVVAGDELFNVLPFAHYMSGGQQGMPVVVRGNLSAPRGGEGPTFGAIQTNPMHALLTHMPGVQVAVPSTPYDAKGLLLTAISGDGPVYFIEHRMLMRESGPVPADEYYLPFGKAVIRRPGKDVTVVAISWMVAQALAAAEQLAREGIDVEVIDPRTLVPFDIDAVAASVAKTHYIVTVDQGYERLNYGSEIITQLAERMPGEIKGFRRIAAPNVPVPASRALTAPFFPSPARIAREIRQLLVLTPGP